MSTDSRKHEIELSRRAQFLVLGRANGHAQATGLVQQSTSRLAAPSGPRGKGQELPRRRLLLEVF